MSYPKKSEALHKLHGTTPTAPAKVTESYVQSGRPKFPKNATPAQRQTMKRICRLLEERRTITPADCEIIFQYACLMDLWEQAMVEIRRDGVIASYTRTDNHGQQFITRKKNEAVPVADSCSKQMLSILKELGLSPKSRDAVKPTSANSGTAVIPGSMADLFGANFEGLSVVPKPLVVPPTEELE
jgi:P27 family predicted phage terminase small subunit